MSIEAFRKAVVAEIESLAHMTAIENGAHPARAESEYRLHAGRVLGLQQAASLVAVYGKQENDDE